MKGAAVFDQERGARTLPISADSSLIEIKYVSLNWGKSASKYRWPNITLTLKQECGLPIENAISIYPKSYVTYFGLTLINSGFGTYYSYYKNPVVKPLYFVTAIFCIADAFFTYGAFSKTGSKQLASIGGLALIKVSSLFNLTFVNCYNDLAKTGYMFQF